MIWSRFFAESSGRFFADDPRPEPSPQIRPAPENLGELGQEAKDLLNNPTLHEALNRVERKLAASHGATQLQATRRPGRGLPPALGG